MCVSNKMTVQLKVLMVFAVSQLCYAGSIPDPNDTGSESVLKEAVNSFGVDLLKYLHHAAGSEDNILISPLNIYTALAMVQLGSAGNTRSEISQILAISQDNNSTAAVQEDLREISRKIQTKPTDPSFPYAEVSMANGVFLHKNYTIQESFAKFFKYYQDGEVINLDFSNNVQEATDAINKWISEKTKGRIPKLYEKSLDPTTRMIIASSLYFSAKWVHSFSREKTKLEKFNTGVKEIEVYLMNQQKVIPYINNPSLQVEAIALPYLGSECKIVFLLPYASQTIYNVTSNLKSEDLRPILANTNTEEVDFKVPRMKFSWSDTLKNALTDLGAKTLFTSADLSNLVSALSENIHVSDVKHATEIQVDEEGTTASAITSITLAGNARPVRPKQPKPFYLNRPFIAFITCQKCILFSAVVHNPTK